MFTDTAPGSSSFGTRFGIIACPAGAQNARATPNKTAMTNTMMTFVAAGEREPQQATGAERARAVCAGDDEPAVEAVGHLPAGQHQHDERQELREADEAQIRTVRA